jgi:predicted membrane-bound mannosyltransferase
LVRRGHLLLAIAGALVVWVLFYSSFFTNPAGLLDSFRCFPAYIGRAVNSHIHPSYYYLKLLTCNKAATGPPWTEAFVVILAVIGIIFVVAKKGLDNLDYRLLDFLALYTLVMLVIYSAIPYKTPWCLLSFYQGLILLAAAGVVAIMNLLGRMLARVVVAAFFFTAATDLGLQAVLASYGNISNPYVYAQPTTDVLEISAQVERVSKAHPAGREMLVWVVCPGGDYWPLPWYLRSFKNVGWWNGVDEIQLPAPVVIASAGLEDRLIAKLYDLSPPGKKNLYVPLFDTCVELRPGVELRGYVTKDLRDQCRQQDAGR